MNNFIWSLTFKRKWQIGAFIFEKITLKQDSQLVVCVLVLSGTFLMWNLCSHNSTRPGFRRDRNE